MSEHDTLAALLEPIYVEWKRGSDHRAFWDFAADRLIAAGVRLAPADTGLREALARVMNAKHGPLMKPDFSPCLCAVHEDARAVLDAEAGR